MRSTIQSAAERRGLRRAVRVAAIRQGAAAGCRAIARIFTRDEACGGRACLPKLRASARGGFGPPHLRASRVRVAACEAHATSDRSRPTKKAGFAETKPACWLNCRDSNPEYQNQNLMCYRYTTVQSDARKRDKDTQFFSIGNPVSLFSPRVFFGRNPAGHQQSYGDGPEQAPTRNSLE